VDYKGISWTLEDRILLVSICREEHRNAIDTGTMNELTNVFTRADLDEEVRAVVLTGQGKYFCAGGDLAPAEATFDAVVLGRATNVHDHVETGGPLAMSVFRSRKPIIAAINGPAVGIGITMTLPMDVRLATPGCKLAFPFVRRGIVPDACASWFLPRIVGLSTALDWVCSGRTFPAEEALQAGLISKICPAATIIAEAIQLARDIVENTAPVAVATARQMFLRMAGAPHPLDAFRIESPAIFELGRSPDAREGVRAFLDKRAPYFTSTVSENMPSCSPWWSENEAINRDVGGPAEPFNRRQDGAK
jgi:enoyl-CoA hydratase/carnithine racemase